MANGSQLRKMETAPKLSPADALDAENKKEVIHNAPELSSIPFYARDLRVVGQMLESRDVVTADLVLVADTYIIQGRMKVSRRSGSLLSLLRNRIMPVKFRPAADAESQKLSPETVILRRNFEDIAEFDSRARCFRNKVNGMPDPYALSQILRSAGAYLDTRKGSYLVGIMLREKDMTIRFETASRRLEEMRQDIDYFYDYWVKMYLRRHKRSQLDLFKDKFPFSLRDEIQRGGPRRGIL